MSRLTAACRTIRVIAYMAAICALFNLSFSSLRLDSSFDFNISVVAAKNFASYLYMPINIAKDLGNKLVSTQKASESKQEEQTPCDTSENNAIMQECQRRALFNKERELNAYSPDRVREVAEKLNR